MGWGITIPVTINVSDVFRIPDIEGGGRWKKLIGPEITEDDIKLQAGHLTSLLKVFSV